VCYFLWQRDNPGPCRVATHFKDWPVSIATRPLLESGADVFIRFNEAIPILRKIIAVESKDSGSLSIPDTKRFENLVSSRKPFGLETSFKGRATKRAGDVLVYQNGGTGYTPRASIEADAELIESWKVFISMAYGAGSDPMPSRVLGRPFVGEPGSVSTETYLCIGPLKSKSEADSVSSYLACRLTRFLVLMHKPSQHATRKVYAFVASQEWKELWTDEGLYAKYALSTEEITFIEKVIRPMDLSGSSQEEVATASDD
jgi:site-specific DNA-methyltransferase (adenine-specific)